MFANRINPMQQIAPNREDFSVAAPLANQGNFGGIGSGSRMMGGTMPAGMGLPYGQMANPPAYGLQQSLAAFYASPNRLNGQFGGLGIPYGMPSMGHFGQPIPNGGYDSSGINPHGMYNGTFTPMTGGGLPPSSGGFAPMTGGGLPPMPANPGGFAAARNLGFGGR
jgi:hypothetical protein